MANINEIGLAIARKRAEEYRKNAHKSEVKTYIPQQQGQKYSDAGYLANRTARGAAQLGAGIEDMGRFSVANAIDAAGKRNNLKDAPIAERYNAAMDASFGAHKWEKGKGFFKNVARQAANLAEWNKHKVFDNSPAATMSTDSFYSAVADGIASRNGGDTEAAYAQLKDKAIGEESWVAEKTNLEEWGQKLDADKDRHGKGVQFAGSVAEAAPTIMAAIAASFIPGDANVAAYGLMGAATGGNTAREAYRGGADITEAVAAGAMAGLSEIVTEKLTGGIWRFGKGLIDKPISYIAGKISKPWVSKFVKYIAGSLGEGAEEILTEEMQYQIESGVWNNEAERLTAKEYLEVFGVGAVLSLVFGTHVFFDSKGKMHVEEEPKQEETTNEASSDQQGTSSEQQAEDKSREEEKEKRFWQRVEEISLDNPTITWTDKQMQAVYDMVEREMAAESNSTLYSTGSVVSDDPNVKQYALSSASLDSQNEAAIEMGADFSNIKEESSPIAKTKIKATEGFTPESLYSALRLAGYDDATINDAMVNVFGENQFSSSAAEPATESAASNNEATQAEQATEQQGEAKEKTFDEIRAETLGKNLTSVPKQKSSISAFDKLRMSLESSQLFNEKLAQKTNNPLLNAYYHFARSAGKAAQFAIGGKSPMGKPKGSQYDSTGKPVGGSLASIFGKVDTEGAKAVEGGNTASVEEYRQEFYDYLRHKHNVNRFAAGKPVFGFGGINSEESARQAAAYESLHPEFISFAQQVYDYNNNLLQMYVDAQLLTEAEKAELQEKYPFYVPTSRDVNQIKGKAANYSGKNIAPGMKEATGGNSDMIDLASAMAQHTISMYQNAAINRYGLQLLDAIENSEGDTKAFVDSQAQIINVEPVTKPAVERVEDAETETQKEPPFVRTTDNRGGTFTVYRDGQKYTIRLSEGLSTAVEDLVKGKTPDGLINAIGKASGIFRDFVTKYDMTFPVRNLFRDAQAAAMYSKHPAAFGKNVPKVVREMVSNGELWKLYQSMGGLSSSFFNLESGTVKALDLSKKSPIKEGAGKAKDLTLGNIESFNVFFEQLPRFCEFYTTISEAGNADIDTVVQALYDSAEITTNFDRGGSLGRAINKVVPFFNAGVQGLSRGARFTEEMIRNKDVNKMLRVAAYAAITGIGTELLPHLIYGNSDDEKVKQAWDETSAYYKNGFFLIWNGKEFIRLPKGRMQGVLSAITNIAISLAEGEDVTAEQIKEELGGAVQNLMPPSPFNGTLFAPIMRADLFDPDSPGETWYGGDIETYADQQKLPYERYDSSTSKIFIKLAEAIAGETGKGISPKKLQTLFEDYFGTTADVIIDKTDSEYEANAVLSKFTVDPTFQNTLSSDFYDLRDKYSDTIVDSRSTKDESAFAVIMEAYLNEVNSQISTLRDEQKKIQNSNLSQRAKEEKMEEYQEQINELMRTAIENEAEYSGKETNYYEELKDEVTSTAKYQAFSKNETEKVDDLIEDYAKYVILDELGERGTENSSVKNINALVDAGFSDADALILVSDLGQAKSPNDKRRYLYDSGYTDDELQKIVEAYGLASDDCNEVWGEAENLDIPYRKYLEAYYIIYSNETGYKKAEKIADVKALGIDENKVLKLWDMIRK